MTVYMNIYKAKDLVNKKFPAISVNVFTENEIIYYLIARSINFACQRRLFDTS